MPVAVPMGWVMGYLQRKLAKMGAKFDRLSYLSRMTHPAFTRLLLGVVPPDLERLPNQLVPDDGLLRRVSECFRQGRGLNASVTPSMWDEHEAFRAPFLNALEAEDLPVLRAAFEDLFGGNLLDGMSHGSSLFGNEDRNPYKPGFVALRTVDCLLSLSEAVGEDPVPNFAQTTLVRYRESLRHDLGATLDRVQNRLGFSLEMPAIGRPYVCRLGSRATAPDILRHAYVAQRMKEMGYGPNSRVLEIGGGFGMLALCARRAGIGNFTIVDLPFVNAIQMGYLGTALSPAEVSGAGEDAAPVQLLPPDSIDAMPDDSFDLVVNCDSLPEMGPDTAAGYLRHIRRLAPRFLSINQEAQKVHGGQAQNRVCALAETVGGFHRQARYRHWMEQGYVEEVYERA